MVVDKLHWCSLDHYNLKIDLYNVVRDSICFIEVKNFTLPKAN